MTGKDEVVEDFTAGNGRVVAKNRVNEPRAVLEVRIVSEHKPDGLDPVEHVAAIPDYTVYRLNALTNLVCSFSLDFIVRFLSLFAPFT